MRILVIYELISVFKYIACIKIMLCGIFVGFCFAHTLTPKGRQTHTHTHINVCIYTHTVRVF